jgi:hypothetical protein
MLTILFLSLNLICFRVCVGPKVLWKVLAYQTVNEQQYFLLPWAALGCCTVRHARAIWRSAKYLVEELGGDPNMTGGEGQGPVEGLHQNNQSPSPNSSCHVRYLWHLAIREIWIVVLLPFTLQVWHRLWPLLNLAIFPLWSIYLIMVVI